MKAHAYRDLVTLSDVQYQGHLARLQAVISKENRLREDLRSLRERMKGSPFHEGPDFHAKSIGADVAWKAWLGRRITSLNGELARILVKKSTLQGKAARAHCKLIAAKEASYKDERETRRRQKLTALQHLSDLAPYV